MTGLNETPGIRWMSSQYEAYLAAGDTNLHGYPISGVVFCPHAPEGEGTRAGLGVVAAGVQPRPEPLRR